MLSYEELVKKVLEKRPELTREELEKIVEKMTSGSSLLTREGALLLLLSEAGGDEEAEPKSYELLKIRNLTSGLGGVRVAGRVLSISIQKLPNGHRMARIKLGDETGKVHAVLWEDAVEQVIRENPSVGDLIRISGGYVREGRARRGLEIHLSRQGRVEKISGEEHPEIPNLISFFPKVSEAVRGDKELIDFMAVVLNVVEAKTVRKEDKTLKLVEAIVADEEDAYLAKVWMEDEGYAEAVKENSIILVSDARLRRDEIIISSSSQIHAVNPEENRELIAFREKTLENIVMEKLMLSVVDVFDDGRVIAYDGREVVRIKTGDALARGDCIELAEAIKVKRLDRRHAYYRELRKISREKCLENIKPPEPLSLSSLRDGMRDVIVRGVITGKSPLAVSITRFGERQVIQFWLKEGEETIPCITWGAKAAELDKIPNGKYVEIRWVNTRLNRFKELEIQLTNDTVIEIL